MAVKNQIRSDVRFDYFNYIFLSIFFVLVSYPFYFVIISSVSDPNMVSTGRVIWWIKGFQLEGYQRIMQDPMIMRGYGNTLLYASVGTALAVFVTLTGAYALSRPYLVGRRTISILILFTMFFHGGLIPTYLVVRGLGLYNTMWPLVLIPLVGVWNVMVSRSFYRNAVHEEIYDSAAMDGCNEIQTFTYVVLPLSKALVAVMALFMAVLYWNDYFRALVYLQDNKRYPLQLVLMQILFENQADSEATMRDIRDAQRRLRLAEIIKYASIMVSSLPLLIAYPFIQRYLVVGVTLGSLKG